MPHSLRTPGSAAMTELEAFEHIRALLVTLVPSRAQEFFALSGVAEAREVALDSITTLELVNALERRLDIVFDDDELLRIRSLDDLIGMIRNLHH
jgi:hypothetical protein